VLGFDDLAYGQIVTGSSYGELSWEQGNLGFSNQVGLWVTPDLSGPSYPHSGPHNLVNGGGSTLIGIGFPKPADIAGAFIAVQGNGASAWAHRLRVHGFAEGLEVGVTDWFEPITTTPTWFDMSALRNVDRILFETPPILENQAYYGLDDLTFTYVPEPASLSLLALGGLLLRRRR
jgi:hypothetical protein